MMQLASKLSATKAMKIDCFNKFLKCKWEDAKMSQILYQCCLKTFNITPYGFIPCMGRKNEESLRLKIASKCVIFSARN